MWVGSWLGKVEVGASYQKEEMEEISAPQFETSPIAIQFTKRSDCISKNLSYSSFKIKEKRLYT